MRGRMVAGLFLAVSIMAAPAFANPTTGPTASPAADPSEEPSADPSGDPSADPSDDPDTTPPSSPGASPSDDPTSGPPADWPEDVWPSCADDDAQYCVESATVTPVDGQPAPVATLGIQAKVNTLGGFVTSFNWTVDGFEAEGVPEAVRTGLIRLTVRTGQFHPRYTMALADDLHITRDTDKSTGDTTVVIEGRNTQINWTTGDKFVSCISGSDCGDETTMADTTGLRFMGNTQDLEVWGSDAIESLDGFYLASDAQARPTIIGLTTGPEPSWSLPYLGNPHLDMNGEPVRGAFNAFMPGAYFASIGTTAHDAAAIGFDVRSTDAETGESVGIPAVVTERDGGVMLSVPDLGYSIQRIDVFNRESSAPDPTPSDPPSSPPSSPPSDPPSSPPSTAPASLTGIVAKGGPAKIGVGWTAPSTTMTGYVATAQPGSHTCTAGADASTCDITGLTNGTTYTVTVVGTAGNGDVLTGEPVKATPADPHLPSTVPAGDGPLDRGPASTKPRTLTLSGDGFAPNSPVTIGIYSTPVALATGTADANGHVSLEVTIPDNYTGAHTMALSGIAPNGAPRVLTLEVRVAAAGALAQTGPHAALLTLTGMTFVAMGVALIARFRRRRHANS
jgi:hypothetical protein